MFKVNNKNIKTTSVTTLDYLTKSKKKLTIRSLAGKGT